jgi:hypothetical protein
MFIRVFAGFLAGIAAGVLMMRIAYKKKGLVKAGNDDATDVAISSRAS